jgi:hypothetical protein
MKEATEVKKKRHIIVLDVLPLSKLLVHVVKVIVAAIITAVRKR